MNTTHVLLAMVVNGSSDPDAAVATVKAAAAAADAARAPGAPDPSNLATLRAEREAWRLVRDDESQPLKRRKYARDQVRAINDAIGDAKDGD